jgi:hypothetical protein
MGSPPTILGYMLICSPTSSTTVNLHEEVRKPQPMPDPQKAYVRYHDPDLVTHANLLVRPRDRVRFSHIREYGRMDRVTACTLRDRLNAARMCSGDHVCLFDIEEVKSGRFAVCCVFHPDFRENEAPDALSTGCASHMY